LGYHASAGASRRRGSRLEATEEEKRGAKQAVAPPASVGKKILPNIFPEISAQIIAPLTAIKQNSPPARLCYNAFIRRAQAKCNSAS
jgi:hypothetical protein